MSKAVPVHVQAKRDADASKRNPVRTLKDMTDEEKAQILANLDSQEYQRATRRAKDAKGGKR